MTTRTALGEASTKPIRAKWKRSKFGVDQSTLGKVRRTLDGVVYDSAFERDYASKLAHQKKLGIILDYKRQVSVRLEVAGKLICTHVVDFVITTADGKDEVRECKGVQMPDWKIKRKLFEALFPGTPYIVVKRES